AFKVWSREGRVLYSRTHELIGRSYAIDEKLSRALRGEVSASISDLDEAENELERPNYSRLLEVYAPVRGDWDGRIVGVAEFYQVTDELDAAVGEARRRAWAVVAAVGLAAYALLGGIVKRGSDTIDAQQRALRRQVVELSALRSRLQEAAGRTTALNEQ